MPQFIYIERKKSKPGIQGQLLRKKLKQITYITGYTKKKAKSLPFFYQDSIKIKFYTVE